LIEELKDLDQDPVIGHVKEASGWARDILTKCLKELIYSSSEKLSIFRGLEKKLK